MVGFRTHTSLAVTNYINPQSLASYTASNEHINKYQLSKSLTKELNNFFPASKE